VWHKQATEVQRVKEAQLQEEVKLAQWKVARGDFVQKDGSSTASHTNEYVVVGGAVFWRLLWQSPCGWWLRSGGPQSNFFKQTVDY
jgi:hypothetical protein